MTTATNQIATPASADRRSRRRRETPVATAGAAVRLVDLSSHGCCLGFGSPVDYRPGQFIRLGFPGQAEAIRAIVRWTEDTRVGAEFTRGLSNAQIEAIMAGGRSPLVGLL